MVATSFYLSFAAMHQNLSQQRQHCRIISPHLQSNDEDCMKLQVSDRTQLASTKRNISVWSGTRMHVGLGQ